MASRTVTDTAGRTWTCTSAPQSNADDAPKGRDVMLACTTESMDAPVALSVGWQWETMAAPGLGRLLTQASPVPRR